MGISGAEIAERAAAIKERVLHAGPEISEARIQDVRPTAGGCLILFSWAQDPRTFGLPVDLRDVTREYLSGGPVRSFGEWLAAFGVNLTAHFDCGVVANAARTPCEGYIELDDRRWWPYAPTIDYAVWDRDDLALATHRLEVGSMSVTPGADPDDGLVTAVSGTPVGATTPTTLAILTASGDEGILRVATTSRARRSLIDCAHLACHAAADKGLATVAIAEKAGLDALGFRPDGHGRWVVDTALLDEDRDALADLDAGQWQ